MKDKLRKFLTVILIVWIIALVGIGSFYYFVIMPQENKLDGLSSKVEYEIETNLVASHAKEKRAMELMAAKDLQAKDLLRRFLVDRANVNNFVFDFQKLADECGIDDFTGSHDPSNSYYNISGLKEIQEGTMRINFSGDYVQFIKLLNSLERYKPVIFIDRFNITRTRRIEGTNTVNIGLTFFVTKESD
ncbi:MAG: GspMb/PilO family protein [Sedimentisphaeraceae bacterium JB056]